MFAYPVTGPQLLGVKGAVEPIRGGPAPPVLVAVQHRPERLGERGSGHWVAPVVLG